METVAIYNLFNLILFRFFFIDAAISVWSLECFDQSSFVHNKLPVKFREQVEHFSSLNWIYILYRKKTCSSASVK